MRDKIKKAVSKMKDKANSTYETYKGIRKTWGAFKPTNRVKGNEKKAQSKKACRGKGNVD